MWFKRFRRTTFKDFIKEVQSDIADLRKEIEKLRKK
jgi:hypothetical protein